MHSDSINAFCYYTHHAFPHSYAAMLSSMFASLLSGGQHADHISSIFFKIVVKLSVLIMPITYGPLRLPILGRWP